MNIQAETNRPQRLAVSNKDLNSLRIANKLFTNDFTWQKFEQFGILTECFIYLCKIFILEKRLREVVPEPKMDWIYQRLTLEWNLVLSDPKT